jgi:hypothetical protein
MAQDATQADLNKSKSKLNRYPVAVMCGQIVAGLSLMGRTPHSLQPIERTG